jgi:hypothetical protein
VTPHIPAPHNLPVRVPVRVPEIVHVSRVRARARVRGERSVRHAGFVGILAVVIAACALGRASTSAAQDRAEPRFYAPKPITAHADRRISVGVLGGYGATLDTGRINGLNAFGVGFGATGGYDIDPIYVGLRLLFFLGDSRSTSAGVTKFDETTIGIEVGYNIHIGIVMLRPEVALGLAMSNAELPDASGMTADLSSDDAYLAPGFVALTSVSRRVFVGVDAHLPFILREKTLRGLTFMIDCGMRF